MAASSIVVPEPSVFMGLVLPEADHFTKESARFVLSLTFTQETQDRVHQLLNKNSEDLISSAEKEELEEMVNANTYLGIVQSRAPLPEAVGLRLSSERDHGRPVGSRPSESEKLLRILPVASLCFPAHFPSRTRRPSTAPWRDELR